MNNPNAGKEPIPVTAFDFDVPESLIAVAPRPHNSHRLLSYNREAESISHHAFDEIVSVLPPNSLIVVNNSQVLKTSLTQKANPELDLQVLNPTSQSLNNAIVLCPSPVPLGTVFDIEGGKFTVTGIPIEGKKIRQGKFAVYDQQFQSIPTYLEKYAEVALPKYISNHRVPSHVGAKDFQTIFAKSPGSLTCPTAGLHFTQDLVNKLQSAGHEFLEITLHIGFGSWGSLDTEYVGDFDLDAEQIAVNLKALARLREAKRIGQPVLAVGTTTVRTLESIADDVLAEVEPKRDIRRLTNLLIYPGHNFRMVDMLLTDFAHPRTPVMMMSAALCGLDELKGCYQEGIEKSYRFDIFGDGLLIM